MNKKQILVIAVGIVCTLLASLLHIGIATGDIQNGVVSLGILVWALVGHDANEADSILKNKVAISGILTSIFWFVSTIFHLDISDAVKGGISMVLLYFSGYYTMNHSSAVHEIQGTVGTANPKYTN